MGFTTNYQIPYPGLGDEPDGAGQMQALAEQVDTKLKPIDDRVGASGAPAGSHDARIASLEGQFVAVPWTPTISGLNLGNGQIFADLYRAGKVVTVHLRIRSAAASPTTAFTGGCTTTLPFTAKSSVPGYGSFGGIAPARIAWCAVTAGTNAFSLGGVRQSDLATVSVSTAFGTATWAASTEWQCGLTYIIE